jgi:hypothetical protein
MRLVDELLEDEQLLDPVCEAQRERHPQSRTSAGQTPVEALLRRLLLKHIRNWSYDVLEQKVRANLVCALPGSVMRKVPDAKTLARLGHIRKGCCRPVFPCATRRAECRRTCRGAPPVIGEVLLQVIDKFSLKDQVFNLRSGAS